MPNLAELLSRSAAERPDRVAVKLDDSELSYAALDEAAARLAGLLRAKGVQPGDRVGIMLPTSRTSRSATTARCARAVVVPMNGLLKEREVAFHLGRLGAKLLLAWHEFADAARAGAAQTDAECVLVEPGEFEALLERCAPVLEVTERRADDTAVILYTSGTTGTPKGAELTHDNLLRNVEVTVDLFGLDERAVTLGALPLFHAFGQTCALNATVAVGGCLTLIPRFDGGKALEIIERDRVTVFEGVPTMYAAMLHHPRPTRDMSPGGVRLRRRRDAGGDHARLRAEVRLPDPRGLRPLGDLAGRVVQPPRPRAQARLDRPADRRRRDARRRRRRRRGAPGRRRRGGDPRPQRHEGLLEARGSDRRGDRRRRLVQDRRHRPRSTRTATSSSSTARRTS